MSATNDRAAWLADRATAIGASESPSIFGVGYETPYALWARKCGLVPNIEGDAERLECGNLLQDDICEMLRRRTGWKIDECPQDVFLRHPVHTFIGATPDFMAEADPSFMPGTGVGDCKNVGAYMGREWSNDEIPLRVQVQLAQQMLVADCHWGVAAAFIGGNKLEYRVIERNAKFEAVLIRELKAFWQRIVDRDPPPVDGSAQTAAVLSRLHPKDNGQEIALDESFVDLANELDALKSVIRRAESRRDEIEATIKAKLGDFTFGNLPDGSGFSWKLQGRKETIQPACEFRVLRRTKLKLREHEPAERVGDIEFHVIDAMRAFGATLRHHSHSGSLYYVMPDGKHVRVSDHEPNDATENWMNWKNVKEIRVDLPDWRERLEELTGTKAKGK